MNVQNQEHHLRLILDTSDDAFVGVDHKGLIVEWNQQAESILGWHRVEAIGQKMDEMIIPKQYQESHRHGMQHSSETGEAKVLNCPRP